jgi:hypothetical protein
VVLYGCSIVISLWFCHTKPQRYDNATSIQNHRDMTMLHPYKRKRKQCSYHLAHLLHVSLLQHQTETQLEQELLTLPEFTPGFLWSSCYSILSFMCMFCRSLFVLLSFFFWPLCCLFVFDLRILINPLVSSNSSYETRNSHMCVYVFCYYRSNK